MQALAHYRQGLVGDHHAPVAVPPPGLHQSAQRHAMTNHPAGKGGQPGRPEAASGAAAGTHSWLLRAVSDPAGTIGLDSLGIAVTLAEIYAGVPLPGPSNAGRERRP